MKSQLVRLDESGITVISEEGPDGTKLPRKRRKLFFGLEQFWQGYVSGLASLIVLMGVIALIIWYKHQ